MPKQSQTTPRSPYQWRELYQKVAIERDSLREQVQELAAAMAGLFERCAMTHKYWGEGSNQKEAGRSPATHADTCSIWTASHKGERARWAQLHTAGGRVRHWKHRRADVKLHAGTAARFCAQRNAALAKVRP